mmetsp:Transcript_10879/g.33362  ORF Transcript_10879/g.33362 Transcript_10879/m.33362 type:complete len:285 (-) Transcript_10879:542-1396(-)|eukprot:CAMPEP_0198733182 /NCGR_PEP_ID=MMETSP1475-20131203/43515_1 /TAXON_ID= ORGANISM="Unidentified sp., Strain CCMP1999" /NCGR_SAMPLE_ID=MMETSP1475 /ASSEMBLY_ACC=CAM_ASM_001111 /LENGTH=284 /DNA_ID=CAMNT_0044496437 /DNA_START=125 /DNA_END=979 /DNA_ORIENTATION=-
MEFSVRDFSLILPALSIFVVCFVVSATKWVYCVLILQICTLILLFGLARWLLSVFTRLLLEWIANACDAGHTKRVIIFVVSKVLSNDTYRNRVTAWAANFAETASTSLLLDNKIEPCVEAILLQCLDLIEDSDQGSVVQSFSVASRTSSPESCSEDGDRNTFSRSSNCPSFESATANEPWSASSGEIGALQGHSRDETLKLSSLALEAVHQLSKASVNFLAKQPEDIFPWSVRVATAASVDTLVRSRACKHSLVQTLERNLKQREIATNVAQLILEVKRHYRTL